ncbi:formate dehydrogenase subunit gamma [Limnobacter litoralis]|uniref:Formate dehydrogenase subunit gamma n=1 Tax=Limnobacter litoralis TaxID=481366 RepID=A0ABQ5YQ22_9BURK|nr:formate dehydrogenase subunit gamma [Limnobacter litoralis]GLR25885.1 formate dehydrogenase subunit gamma [Limnobacter litoralis]
MTTVSMPLKAAAPLTGAVFKWLAIVMFAMLAVLFSGVSHADQTALSKEQAARQAEQPGNNAPVWRAASSGESFVTQAKGRETGVLINKSGEVWREIRNDRIIQYGGWLVSLAFLAIMAVYLLKGPIKLPEKRTGRLIERFTSAERLAHWTMAFSFVALGTTGLLLMFGKYVVAPVLGLTAFSWIAILCKNVHNFVGPLFSVSIIVFFVMYVKDNLPEKNDMLWLKKAGGLFGHVPAGRFNMGEKVWFWGGVTALGIAVSVTGYILDFPNFDQVRLTMQQAHVVHATAAIVFISMALGHIYIGSIGMEGALEAMRDGYVDETWAKAHHEDWYNDIKAGKVPAVRSKQGAEVMGSQVLS